MDSRSGRFSLGTRTLLELGAYLKNAYDESELLDCTVCFEVNFILCSVATSHTPSPSLSS